MTILKSTQEILDNPWNELLENEITLQQTPPLYSNPLSFNEIEVWEQIYFKSGNIGIYGAWRPYAEFYIITYNLFIKTPAGIEIYQGKDAGSRVWKKAKELGISLPVTSIWNNTGTIDTYLENLKI